MHAGIIRRHEKSRPSVFHHFGEAADTRRYHWPRVRVRIQKDCAGRGSQIRQRDDIRRREVEPHASARHVRAFPLNAVAQAESLDGAQMIAVISQGIADDHQQHIGNFFAHPAQTRQEHPKALVGLEQTEEKNRGPGRIDAQLPTRFDLAYEGCLKDPRCALRDPRDPRRCSTESDDLRPVALGMRRDRVSEPEQIPIGADEKSWRRPFEAVDVMGSVDDSPPSALPALPEKRVEGWKQRPLYVEHPGGATTPAPGQAARDQGDTMPPSGLAATLQHEKSEGAGA